MAIAEFLDVW